VEIIPNFKPVRGAKQVPTTVRCCSFPNL